jgi:hypothetical protein
MKGELLRHRQSAVLLPKGTLECVVDATSLFRHSGWHGSILDRAAGVRFSDYTLRHDVQVGTQFREFSQLLNRSRKRSTTKRQFASEPKLRIVRVALT